MFDALDLVGLVSCRHYLILLQGTWFYQIGFILYPLDGMGKWALDDTENIMATTLIYAWHMIGCFLGRSTLDNQQL